MRRFVSLRRQADFARLRRRGSRVPSKSLVIYRSDPLPGDRSSVVGITVKKAIGKAVLRNKLRRRLSAILHDALATYGPMRLLLVAQSRAADLPFADLRAEVTSALERA